MLPSHPCWPCTKPFPEKPGSILHALLAWGKTLFLNLEGFLQAGGQDQWEVQL